MEGGFEVSQHQTFAVDGFLLTETDEFGCLWTVEDVTGWYTGAQVRTSVEARPQQHGDRRGQAFRAGRVVTLRGKVHCPDATAMELAGKRLASVLALGGFGPLNGSSPAGDLETIVQLEDEPFFDPWSDRIATWQLTVGSESPLLYGMESVVAASLDSTAAGTGRVWARVWPRDWGVPAGVMPDAVTVPNAGTASYHPRLRIQGPVTNPVVRLVESGASVRYNGSIPAGTWLDVLCADRLVLLRGQVSHRHLVSFTGDWLSVPPGGGTVSWSADSFGPGHSLTIFGTEGAWA